MYNSRALELKVQLLGAFADGKAELRMQQWASFTAGTVVGMVLTVVIVGTNPPAPALPCPTTALTFNSQPAAAAVAPNAKDVAAPATAPAAYTGAAVAPASGGPPPVRSEDQPLSDTPDDELTALLRRIAKDNLVVATTTDGGYLELTVNWICHMKKLGLEAQVLIFSLDEKIHAEVQELGVASYYEATMSKESESVGNWNSKSYNQVVHTKTKHQRAVLERGFDLFFADVDIPWTSDLRDRVLNDVVGLDFVGQQNWPQNDMNTGFMYMRSNARMLRFVDAVLEVEHGLENNTIRAGADPRKDVFYPTDDQSSIAFVLICGFPNGTYPGRGDLEVPQGGEAAPGIVVHNKWQRRVLGQKHGLTSRGVKKTEQTRPYTADCLDTSGVDIAYGLFAPKYYQTGHKDWARLKMDASLTADPTVMYHPNFMKGSQSKKTVLGNYGRWIGSC